jgi:hypothetical protein
MRIIGLISWYDEKPEWLAAAVASMAPFVDHVVAVDGAYMAFPGGKARSPAGQAEAVREAARACKLGVTVHEPQERWGGGEVQKRSFLFRLAETVSRDENDWYFVLDADELVTDVGVDVRATLMDTGQDVGQVTLWEHRGHYDPDERPFVSDMVEQQPARRFVRAVRGLTVLGNHFTYVTPDGRQLWGAGTQVPLELPEDLAKVLVEHRNKGRDLCRAEQAKGYCDRRECLDLEGIKEMA